MSVTEEIIKEFDDVANKVCSIMVGIPNEDLHRLRKKHNKIIESVHNTLKLLEELSRDEPEKYKKFLFSSYFDYCFDFLSKENKIDTILDILGREIFSMSKDTHELKSDFCRLFREELYEVRKNRGTNRTSTTRTKATGDSGKKT